MALWMAKIASELQEMLQLSPRLSNRDPTQSEAYTEKKAGSCSQYLYSTITVGILFYKRSPCRLINIYEHQ